MEIGTPESRISPGLVYRGKWAEARKSGGGNPFHSSTFTGNGGGWRREHNSHP